jgi:DNA-binding beta-propeller fold protein YncE
MTHDGQLLIAAAGPLVYFLDVGNLIANGPQSVLGSISDGPGAGSIDVNVTADDRWLFVADENLNQITVIDLDRARSGGYPQDAIVGAIPTGEAPTHVDFSADGQWLYSTSEVALPIWGWPAACIQEGQTANQTLVNPQGAVVVANVAQAVSSPAQSVASHVPAGCSPVRMSQSPSGDRLYVTMRNNNAVEALDTSQFLSNPSGALLGSAPVGIAPVPLAVLDRGRLVLVGNSDRFEAPTSPQTLSLLNAAAIVSGGSALLATLPTGAFPRTISLSPDLRTLYISDFGPNMLQVLDLSNLIVAGVTAW